MGVVAVSCVFTRANFGEGVGHGAACCGGLTDFELRSGVREGSGEGGCKEEGEGEERLWR